MVRGSCGGEGREGSERTVGVDNPGKLRRYEGQPDGEGTASQNSVRSRRHWIVYDNLYATTLATRTLVKIIFSRLLPHIVTTVWSGEFRDFQQLVRGIEGHPSDGPPNSFPLLNKVMRHG